MIIRARRSPYWKTIHRETLDLLLVSLFILFSPFVDDVPLSPPPPTPLCSRAHEKPIVVLCVYVGAVPYRLTTLRTFCGRLCAGSFKEPRIGMWWNPIVQRSSSSSRQVEGFSCYLSRFHLCGFVRVNGLIFAAPPRSVPVAVPSVGYYILFAQSNCCSLGRCRAHNGIMTGWCVVLF